MTGFIRDGIDRLRRGLRAAGGLVRRFLRDEQGGALEYVLVLSVVGTTVPVLVIMLLGVLADYFGMIAFYVSWPFL